MRYRKWLIPFGLMVGMLGLQSPSRAAEGDWSVRADMQGLYGSYTGSVQRKSMYSAGVIVTADYLDRGGFAIGGTHSKVRFKTSPDIRQESTFGSLRYNLYLDSLPGALTLRLDGHSLNNNDTTGNTDNVGVIAPQVSFLNFDRTLYLDIGYARSSYKNSLKVNQYTATLGRGLNAGADWLQARAYFIDPSNAARAQNKNNTTAVELKWQHWFAPDNLLNLDNIVIAGLLGERIYAVDGDAASVYNLADIQRGSYSLGMEWKPDQALWLLLIGGQEYYRNNAIANSYHSTYFYADISAHW